jgi:hypothetical protein
MRSKTLTLEHCQSNKDILKMPSLNTVDNGLIKMSFLQAAHREEFQQKWMSAETWAQLIVKYSIVDSNLMFNGDQLDKCINSQEKINVSKRRWV